MCITTTIRTSKLWFLKKGGHFLGHLHNKSLKWDLKIVVFIDKWSLFESGRSLRFDCTSILACWNQVQFYKAKLTLKVIICRRDPSKSLQKFSTEPGEVADPWWWRTCSKNFATLRAKKDFSTLKFTQRKDAKVFR